jgi:hypothetical protein
MDLTSRAELGRTAEMRENADEACKHEQSHDDLQCPLLVAS